LLNRVNPSRSAFFSAAFISYNFKKQFSKDKVFFGKGNPKGVAASESANNGVEYGEIEKKVSIEED